MRRNFTKGLLMGALAMSGLASQTQQTFAKDTVSARTTEAIAPKETDTKVKSEVRRGAGGLKLPGQFGLTPKEYGQRYGTGASRKGKSNRLRLGHNAKVGRRNAA